MRSRLAKRPVRLVLAAAAALALAGGVAATASATGDGGGETPTQSCGTNDLTFSLNEETQAGGYYQITAKAKPGITCWLEGVYPSASFTSDADTEVSPSEQSVSENIKLSGDKVAYSGINPNPGGSETGVQSDKLHLAIEGYENHAVTLDLPREGMIDKPTATNWHADASDAVPFPS